ncbi:hypothetical protein [Citrobacter braakii]|uniref:hypothetical protein n=1 Tax=Citrobacter braakii TaxID=57706 RepID=UPI0011EF8B84|nr:hypothetical protein [Citrobacter braakii]
MNNREQFEEWVDSNFPFKKDRFHIFRDEYKSQFTRQLWEAWQASRAEVEVEVNRLNIEIENLECAHICLDDVGVPRKEGDETLSLWGRIVSYKSSTDGC